MKRSQDRFQSRKRKSAALSDLRPRSASLSDLRSALIRLRALIEPPVGDNPNLAQLLDRLANALAGLTDAHPDDLIRAVAGLAKRPRSTVGANKSENGYEIDTSQMSLREIESLVSTTDLTKEQLLSIARNRFGVPVGTLLKLSKESLIKRIGALIMNARGHDTIARMASREDKNVLNAPNGSTAVSVQRIDSSNRDTIAKFKEWAQIAVAEDIHDPNGIAEVVRALSEQGRPSHEINYGIYCNGRIVGAVLTSGEHLNRVWLHWDERGNRVGPRAIYDVLLLLIHTYGVARVNRPNENLRRILIGMLTPSGRELVSNAGAEIKVYNESDLLPPT